MTPIEDAPAAGGWNLRDPAVLLGTGFGLGLLPVAPGTWGSLGALPVAWAIVEAVGRTGLAVAGVAAFIVGIWACEACVRKHGKEDPKELVIDEIAGQWLVLAVVPPGLALYAAGFVLFRVFDILKPWPVGWADREVKGGFGVMLDDLLAAVYAGAILFAAARWWGA